MKQERILSIDYRDYVVPNEIEESKLLEILTILFSFKTKNNGGKRAEVMLTTRVTFDDGEEVEKESPEAATNS